MKRKTVNIEKVLELLARGQTKASWSESINEMIKLLKRKRRLKDRLDYAELLMEVLNAMTYNVNGWHQWGNIYRLNKLSEEEYKEFVPKLLEIAVEWLKIDRDLTARKEKEMKEEAEKEKKVASTKDTPYVA